MTYAEKLTVAIADAKKKGVLREHTNPLDAHHFAIYWLLEELDRLSARVAQLEGDTK